MTLAVGDFVRYFVLPVGVLLLGVLVTGILLPELTRRRDNRRKALEIKTELVSAMSEAVMDFMMAVQFIVLGSVTFPPDEYADAYRTWEKKRSVIGTKLEAYFPKTDLGSTWSDFAHRVTAVYGVTEVEDAARRANASKLLTQCGEAWPGRQPEDDDARAEWMRAWGLLREGVFEEKRQLISRVMHERATAVEGERLFILLRRGG